MRKITKRFCEGNPVLLAYYRESRRYSPLDIRIRKASIDILNTVRSIPVSLQAFQLSHIQSWISSHISITILQEFAHIKPSRQHREISIYQI